MRYGTISHTPAPNIYHSNLETFQALVYTISKTSGQMRETFFWLVCLFVRILEQQLLSFGMYLTQCNFTYLWYYLNSLHTQTVTQSEVVRPTGSLRSFVLAYHASLTISEPCFQAAMFPAGSSHLSVQETLSMETDWGWPGTTSSPEHHLETLRFV